MIKTYDKRIILVDKFTVERTHRPCVNRVIRLDDPRNLSEFYSSSYEELEQLVRLAYPNSYLWVGGLDEDLPNELIYEKSTGYVRKLTDKEMVELMGKEVMSGEKLVGDTIVRYDPETENVDDEGNITKKTREELIKEKKITLETERTKARRERKKVFEALDLYDIKVVRGDIKETEEMKQARDEYRQVWLNLPNEYVDITIPIEDMYPTMPATVKYFSK